MVGVQRLPTAALPQPATLPTPAERDVRSNVTGVATPVVNIANPGTFIVPARDPVRLAIVPPVSPAKAPVSVAPAVFTKLGLKLILVPVTVTLPAMFASPVIGAESATFVSNEHDTKPRPRTRKGLNLMCI